MSVNVFNVFSVKIFRLGKKPDIIDTICLRMMKQIFVVENYALFIHLPTTVHIIRGRIQLIYFYVRRSNDCTIKFDFLISGSGK